MIKALIVDDEDFSRDCLKTLIEKHIPEITSVHLAADAITARMLIEQHHPQLVFLDVEMPRYSGFDLLNMIAEKNFDVIFTTSFAQYAIKAIRFSALDYLLKPVKKDELIEAVQRHLEKRDQENHRPALYKNFLNTLQKKDIKDFRLAIPTTEGVFFFHPDEIIRCDAVRSYTKFFLSTGKTFLASKPLREYDELLQENGFLRVHKSHLVNTQHILRYLASGFLLMKDESKVEVARRRKAEIESVLRSRTV
ncbi:MAG: response regulator [Chitinophagales bacterium]|nr:response regulator [Chitinophagales bacterium]